MEQHFETAAWSISLRVTSAFGTILIVGVTLAALRLVPYPRGLPPDFGLIALVPVAVLAITMLFVVTGYTISPSELGIRRLLWTTTIRLDGLQRVTFDPTARKRSVRLFGNDGLYAVTGLYWNSRLGRYRVFATDFSHAVVLTLQHRTIVITPASPQAFVETVRHFFPATNA